LSGTSSTASIGIVQSSGPSGFTCAFFHRPEELRAEVAEAGFTVEAVLGIEGPGWLDEDRWLGEDTRALALYAARAVEAESSLSTRV
jgi:hypothetical protein